MEIEDKIVLKKEREKDRNNFRFIRRVEGKKKKQNRF